MLGQHVRCRLRNDATLAAEPEARRAIATAVLARDEGLGLIAFGVVDTHLHLLNHGERGNELARRVEISLTKRLRFSVGFAEVHVEALRNQWHMYNAFRYDLTQDEHHDLRLDPLAEGTNLPDLLGARLLGGYTCAAVRRHLPRIGHADLLRYLGVDAVEPADGPLEQIADAAAASLGLPGLSGRSARTVTARAAAVAVVGQRLSARQTADLLGCERSTVRRLRQRTVEPRLVLAVRLQLGMRRARLAAALAAPVRHNRDT